MRIRFLTGNVPSPHSARLDKKTRTALFFIGSLLLLCSCTSTSVMPPEPEPHLAKVVALARHPVAVSITPLKKAEKAGRQFLFLIIPFGTVYIWTPQEHVFSELKRSLALRGLRPVGFDSSREQAESLEIVIEKMRVSAFDLLFVRRISASVSLKMTRKSSKLLTPVTVQVSESASSFRKFGFERELKKTFHEALRDAIFAGMEGLRYPPLPVEFMPEKE